jgi:hypothetical protein
MKGEGRHEERRKGRVEQRSLSSAKWGEGYRMVTTSTQAAIGMHGQLEVNPSPNRKPFQVSGEALNALDDECEE